MLPFVRFSKMISETPSFQCITVFYHIFFALSITICQRGGVGGEEGGNGGEGKRRGKGGGLHVHIEGVEESTKMQKFV